MSDKAEGSPFQMEYVENSITSDQLIFSLNAKSAGTLSYRVMTQLGELKLKGDESLIAGSNQMSINLDGIDVGTYQLAIKVKNDIEVFAVRKTDNNDIPTATLGRMKKN